MLHKYLLLLKSTTQGDISLLLQRISAGVLKQSVSMLADLRRWSVFPLPNLTLTKHSYQSYFELVMSRQKQMTLTDLHCCPPLSPGKALLDVLVLGSVVEPPPVKDSLLLLGALKHMSCWHSAKITLVTQNPAG